MIFKSQITVGQYVLLSAPIYQAVYQRDNTNYGYIPVSGQIINSTGSSYTVECITNLLDEFGNVKPGTTVTTLITNATSKGLFHGTVGRIIGWYSLNIKYTSNATGLSSSTTAKCGVGDVFIIAGQSNGQGDNGASFTTSSIPEWIVGNVEEWNCRKEFEQRPTFMSKINGSDRISPAGNNSWCYGVLGKKISDANGGMPVAFFNTAAGGSSVKNWNDGANNLSGINQTQNYRNTGAGKYWCDDFATPLGQLADYFVGQPYLTLKNVLNWYVPLFGVRAILWHQGESDAANDFDPNDYLTRNSATYTNLLNGVISKSISDLGANVSWMIANVSYSSANTSGGTSPNGNAPAVLSGQSASTNGNSVRIGPLTDKYNNASTGVYRYDNTHFSEGNSGGLTVLANLWNSVIDLNSSSITGFNRISSAPVPEISIAQSGSNYTFSVNTSPNTSYCWTAGNTYAPPLSGCLSTSNSISGTGGALRCYVKTGNNWQSTAQATQVNCPSCREELNEFSESDGGINMKLYPNPSDKDFRVEFDVPEDDKHVKLEFFDMVGKSVKVIADGSHAKGHFTYPITEALPTGTTICQLKVGEIFISKKIVRVN